MTRKELLDSLKEKVLIGIKVVKEEGDIVTIKSGFIDFSCLIKCHKQARKQALASIVEFILSEQDSSKADVLAKILDTIREVDEEK